MIRWYWLRPDHSTEPGPDSSDKDALQAYSDWLFGVDPVTGRPNKVVAQTDTNDGGWVSTVFLGLDHGFHGEPILFESMHFIGSNGSDQKRYRTWDEAMAGHHLMVALHKGPREP